MNRITTSPMTSKERPIAIPATGGNSANSPANLGLLAAGTQVFNLEPTLERLGGNRSLFVTLAEFFLEDVDKLVERLQAALHHQTPREIELAAHGIKGLCATFDGSQGVAAAWAIERAAQAKDLDNSPKLIEPLISAIAHLKEALTSEIRSRPAVDE